MNRAQAQKKDGKLFTVACADVTPDYVHPLFEVRAHPGQIAETGLLQVLEIEPTAGGLPSFSGRWDQRAYELDFDIHDVPGAEEQDFIHGRRGYRGHHSQRAQTDIGWKYLVSIAVPAGQFASIPDGRVFEGAVRLTGLQHQMELNATSGSQASSAYSVTHPRGIMVWLRRAFHRFLVSSVGRNFQ